MSSQSKILLFVLFLFPFHLLMGQETPYQPISYRIFSPFIFNPAVAGSKDFTSVDLIASMQNNSYSHVASVNTRLWRRGPKYAVSPKLRRYSNIGVGGAVFNDVVGLNRNLGMSLTGSYHIALNEKELSFLSFGLSAKGIYSHIPGNTLFDRPEKNLMSPNFDVGVYYYNPNFYIGFSATNILGNPEEIDSEGLYTIPVDKQYFFHTGYKFVLSRVLDIVLEPSLIISSGDTLYLNAEGIKNIIRPGLRLYMDKFCVGTYFQNFDKIPFFFQYKYPNFYVGAFFEIPRNIPFYKRELTAEIAVGMNFGADRFGNKKSSHW
ncbi:MAG: PorP/SprF family type IX secretion system membrane protein [Bacteroidales bacterium]|jgi:type IX secretion system PorP/SprF family membrane protein|nr:PorP/SprF family type IX secretion system membrane protein [Bacteroidales bacterium]